ncbi:LamG domain-containing protein [Streptacidiphilus sp. PB12-B1b]|uniref:LamG domain-containing protein n=1 Tax=Streptacidiphilus sp. PB12-B1b TaxID=2705012 RepID=UPI0015FAB5ED|nr:LamG domain-containing protein [Streptacidiphilus sp. PB12-B1b]QMU76644.1 LamG domain-containing protein [Streptacidiphilus sp. PB12-B1b]
MKRSRARAVLAAIALAAAAGTAAAPGAAAAPVAPVAFTANNLPTWQTNGVVWALAQAGGLVFAGGTFTAIRPPGSAIGVNETPAANFMVLDAATGAPTGCRLNFTVSSGTPTIRALAVSPDGRTLYVGGYFDHVNNAYVQNLVAIDIASCSLDTGFTPSLDATVRTILPTGTGLYVGGDFTTADGVDRQHLAQLSSTGALTAWAPTTDQTVRSMVLSPDGSEVVVGGDFNTLNGGNSHALGIVNAGTGATVKDYPLGFIEQNSVVKDLISDSTGFYTANEGTGGGVFDGRIAIDWSTLNQRWRDTCLGATQALALYGGVLYAGSHTHDCSSMGEQPDGRRQHLIAEPTSTGTELGWDPDTNDGPPAGTTLPPGIPPVEGVGPRAMTIATEGGEPYLWVSGEFTSVNGVGQQSLTRFGTGPDLAAPTAPALNVVPGSSPGQLQVRVRTATDEDDPSLTYSIYRDGGSTPVWTGTASSQWWSRPQIGFTDTGLTPGTVQVYQVKVSDGRNTAVSGTVGATVPGGSDAYADQVLADGARLFWRYDGNAAFVADTSGGGQTGLFNGGGTLNATGGPMTGTPDGSMTFNGSSGFVYDEVQQTEQTSYSAEVWFKTTTTRGGQLLDFSNKQTATTTRPTYGDHLVYLTNAGKVAFGSYNSGTHAVVSPRSYNDGQWHQAVVTQGPHGMSLYVDGALVGSGTTLATSSYVPYGYWHVGGDAVTGWPQAPSSAYFAGSIAETSVYPTVLTAAQVAKHYSLRTS